jgi:hypothetical protein
MVGEGGRDIIEEVEKFKLHGDHNPGDNLPEGGRCKLEESALSDNGVIRYWSCGHEDIPGRTHSG